MCFVFGDSVVSACKYSKGKIDVVMKTTNDAVHVKFYDGMYQKFFFNPTHHMQTSIDLLKKNT